jgi:hypothetical protein
MSDKSAPRILYCHCAYSNVILASVKEEVLRRLCDSDVAFDGVADLCEMSARKDPSLGRLVAGEGEIRIAACYPRAVEWLFSAAGAPLPKDQARVLNMRTESAEEVVEGLLAPSESSSEAANDSRAGN